MQLIVSATSEELRDIPGVPLGLGPIMVTARLATLLAKDTPSSVLFLGTGVRFPGGPEVGTAVAARRVGLSPGVAAMGLGYVPRSPDPVSTDPELTAMLDLPVADVLTTHAIPTDPVLTERLSDGWQVQHLEAFGAAWACHVAGVPFVAVLGIYGEAGEDAHTQWLLHRHEAQARAREACAPLLNRSHTPA